MNAPVGRRGFLRALGLSPIAVRQVADKALADAAKIDVSGLSSGGGARPSNSVGAPISHAHRHSLMTKFLKQFGLPDWEVDRMRRDTRNVWALDHDIANKCWSMSVKIATQRERNFARAMDSVKEAGAYDAARDAFRERHGFWFWW